MEFKTLTPLEKIGLAKSSDISGDMLRDLIKSNASVDIKYYAAKNPNLPLGTLRGFAKDSYWAIRRNVAGNPTTPDDVLRDLIQDTDYGVRFYAVQNLNASITTLVMFFENEKNLQDPDEDIIKLLYENKKLPAFAKRVIETLFGDML